MTAQAPRVVLRPLATPLPLGSLALVLATVPFSAVQLGVVAVAATGMAVLAGTSAVMGLATLTSPPGCTR